MQDSLGGNSRTTIVAAISPSAESAHETQSTLAFAQRAKHMRNRAHVNTDTQGDVDMLRREVQRLHQCGPRLCPCCAGLLTHAQHARMLTSGCCC